MDLTDYEDQSLPALSFLTSANPDQLHEVTANAQLNFSDDGASALSSMERSLPSHRMMTMKEYDQKIADLNKENFSLKLRIYFLEEKMQTKFGAGGRGDQDAFRANIELKVELESLKTTQANKNQLLQQTLQALEQRDAEHTEKMAEQKSEHEAECLRLNAIIEDLKRDQVEAGAESEDATATTTTERRSVEWFRQAFSLADVTRDATELVGGDPQLQQRLTEMENTVAELNDRLAEGRLRIEELEAEMSKKDDYIKNREMGIDRRNKGLYGLVEICKTKTRELEEASTKSQEQSKEIDRLKGELAKLNDRSALQDLEIKSHEIKDLKEQLNQSQLVHEQHLEEGRRKIETIAELSETLSTLKTNECLLQRQLRSSLLEVEKLKMAGSSLKEEVAAVSPFRDNSLNILPHADSLPDQKIKAEQPSSGTGARDICPSAQKGVGAEHQLKLARAEINRLRFLLESTEQTMRALSGREKPQRCKEGFFGERHDWSLRWSDFGPTSRGSSSAPCTPVKEQSAPGFAVPSTNGATINLVEQRLMLEKLCANLEARGGPCPCVDAACQTEVSSVPPTLVRPSSVASSFLSRRGSVSAMELHGGLCELLHVRLEELATFLERLLRAEADGSLDQSRPRLLDEIRGHLRDCELSLSLTQTVYDTSLSTSEASDIRDASTHRLSAFAVQQPPGVSSSSAETGTVTLDSSPVTHKTAPVSNVTVASQSAMDPGCRRNLHLDSYELSSLVERRRRSTVLACDVREDEEDVVVSRGGDEKNNELPSYLQLSFGGHDPSSFLASTGVQPRLSEVVGAAAAEISAVSESDSWSEPDRRVSRQRIGLDHPAQLTPLSREGGQPFGMSPGRARDYLSSTSATDGRDDVDNFKVVAASTSHRSRSDHREVQRLLLQLEELEEINVTLRAEVDLYRRSANGGSQETSSVMSPRAPMRTPPRRLRARSGESSSNSPRGADALSRRAFSTYLHEISSLRVQLEKSISTYDLLREQFEKRLANSKENVQLQDEYCVVCNQLEKCHALLKDREAELCGVKSEKDLLYAEIQELTEKFEAYRETIESLRTMLEEKRKCSAEAEQRLATLEEAVASGERATKEALNESERTRKHLLAQSERLRRAESAGEQLHSKLSKIQQLLHDREEEGLARADEVDRIRTELDHEVEVHRQRIKERDSRVAELESEINDFQIRLKEATAVNESLRVQLRTARSEIEQANGERQSKLVTELRSLHQQLERSVEVNQALRSQLDDRTDDNRRDTGATTSAASSQEETSSSFAFSLRRASDSENRDATCGDATIVFPAGAQSGDASQMDRQVSKSSDYASVSDEGGGRHPHSSVEKLKDDLTDSCGTNNSPLSPDLGIESDRSRFSSLERRTGSSLDGGTTTGSMRQSTEAGTTPYLKPGFPPGSTDWTVINTAPAKCTEGVQPEHSVMLNATFAGFQKREVTAVVTNSISGDTVAKKEVTNISSYRVSKQDDFRLLRRGITEGVNVLRSVRDRVDRRLSTLRSGNGDGTADDAEVVAWQEMTSGCDALKGCLRECCYLLGRSWAARLPLISTDFEGGLRDADQNAKTMEAELMRLYFELAKERKRAEEALHKLQIADRTKEKMEKAIIKQLNKTHCVLKKARGNLEHQTKGAVVTPAPLHFPH